MALRMSSRVDTNIYITCIPADANDTARRKYELQKGPVVQTLDRYQRANDDDFREAWAGLCAVTVGLSKGKLGNAEHRSLDPIHDAYVVEVADRHGKPVRGTFFTETHDNPPTTEILSVQVTCRDDRLYFLTDNEQDIRLVSEAFNQACRLLVRNNA